MGGNSLLGLAYTYSKAISFADNSDSGLTWHWAPAWNRNRSVASFDRPQNLQIYGNLRCAGRGKKWATSGVGAKLASGWQLNGIFSAVSGPPFMVASAATSVNAPGNTQTADQVAANARILGGVGGQLLPSVRLRAGY